MGYCLSNEGEISDDRILREHGVNTSKRGEFRD